MSKSILQGGSIRPGLLAPAASDDPPILERSLRGLKYLTLLNFLEAGVALAGRLLLVRLLAPEVFGQFAVLMIIIEIAGVGFSLEGRKYVISRRARPEAVSAAHSIETTMGLIGVASITIIATPLLAFFDLPTLRPQLIPLLLLLATTPFLNVSQSVLQSRMAFGRILAVNVTGVVLEVGTTLALAFLGLGLWALVFGLLAGRAARLIMLKGVIGRPYFRTSRSALTDAARYGLPLTAAALVMMSYWKADDVMVGRLLDPAALGAYYIAFQFPHYLLNLVNRIGDIALPAFAELLHDRTRLRTGLELATKISAIMLLLPAAISLIWGRQIVDFAFGPQWASAAPPFMVFMGLIAFRGMFRYWADIALVDGRTKFVLWISLAVVSVLIPTGVIFTKYWGITGMASAVALSLVSVAPIYIGYARRRTGIRYLRLLWPEAVTVSVACGVGLAVTHAPGLPETWRLPVGLLMMTASYGVTTFVLNRQAIRDIRAASKDRSR